MPRTTIPMRQHRPLADLSRLPLQTGGSNLPSNRAVQALAHDVLNSLKYSFTAAAADITLSSPGPADTMFSEFLASRSPNVRATHRNVAAALLKAPAPLRERTLGRYGRVEASDYARVGHTDLANLTGPLPVDSRQLEDALRTVPISALRLALPVRDVQPSRGGKVKLVLPPEAVAEAKDHVEGAKFKKLGLFIKEVECLEETDEVGSDEICLGGVFTDADGQATHLVNQFQVSSDFDAGESVFYPPPVFPGLGDPEKLLTFMNEAYQKPGKRFAEWTIRRDLGWPTAYGAVIAMAEKDDGGFWKFLQQLMKRVVEEVEKVLKMGLGAAAGAVIGLKIGGAWGAVIGAVVGFVVGAIIDLLTQDNADDIVAQASPIMMFGAATRSYYEWAGLLKQPHPDLFPINFKGDGGHYRVWCYYQVYA